jgi:hypothetical protein
MPEVSQNSMRKFSTGFIGCIKDMMLAEEYQFSLVEKAQSGSNIETCVPKLILVNISEIPILKIQSDEKISWTVIKSTVGHVNFHT